MLNKEDVQISCMKGVSEITILSWTNKTVKTSAPSWSVNTAIRWESEKTGKDVNRKVIAPQVTNVIRHTKCVVQLLSQYVPNQRDMEIVQAPSEDIGITLLQDNVNCSNLQVWLSR